MCVYVCERERERERKKKMQWKINKKTTTRQNTSRKSVDDAGWVAEIGRERVCEKEKSRRKWKGDSPLKFIEVCSTKCQHETVKRNSMWERENEREKENSRIKAKEKNTNNNNKNIELAMLWTPWRVREKEGVNEKDRVADDE